MKAKFLLSLKYAFFLSMWLATGANVFSQNFSWAQHWGGTGIDQVGDIEVDAEGNSYVTGIFTGTVDFDAGPATLSLTSTETTAIFVGKYNALGRPIWVKAFQGQYAGVFRRANGITVDKDKNVYTTGVFRGVMDFDPGPGVANLSSYNKFLFHSFVCKLDSAGNFEWVKRLGKDTAGSEVEATAIAVDGNRNVYTTGYFEGAIDFDPGTAEYDMAAGKASDGFVCKFDPDGNFLWAKKFSGPALITFDEVKCHSLALDADGSVYTTGEFFEKTDFDPGPDSLYLLAPFASDFHGIFVSKLDNAGNLAWAKSFGSGSYRDRGVAIVVDPQKNVYTVGEFGTGADFDPGPGVDSVAPFSVQEVRTYISKLDAAGNFVWARSLNDPHSMFGQQAKQELALDGAGDVYVSGSFSGTVDFNTAPASAVLTSSGGFDGFAGKWDASGNLVWVKAYGGPGNGDFPQGLGVDSQKNVYIGGAFTGTADFNPDAGQWNLTSPGTNTSDAFLMKLSRCTPIEDEETLTLCRASYQWPLNGQLYTGSGAYWAAGKSVDGCDSVVVLHLTLNPISGESLTQVVCESHYLWPHTGIDYTASGTYRDTVSAGGCDSIVTLHLQINPLGHEETVASCGSYTWAVTGETYGVSGVYVDTLALPGCDSVRKLVLTVTEITPLNNIIQIIDASTVASGVIDAELYEWYDCQNFSLVYMSFGRYFTPVNPGIYAVAVTIGACRDTSSCQYVGTDMGVAEAEAAAFRIFPNPVQDKFQVVSATAAQIDRVTVTDLDGRQIYSVQVTGGTVTIPSEGWKAGVYFVRVTSETSQHIYKVCKL